MTSDNTAAQVKNKRDYSRIRIDLDAVLQLNSEKLNVKIVDMSSSGLRIESGRALPLTENIALRFALNHHHVALRCSIVHAEVSSDEDEMYYYGVKYVFVSVYDLRVITSYTFEAESKSYWK